MGIFEELQNFGLVTGTRHTVENIASSVGRAFARTHDYLKDVTSNSARSIGGVYLIGDAIVTASPSFNKEKAHTNHHEPFLTRVKAELKSPYNQLQYAQGLSTLLQSLIFMQYARDGQDLLVHDLTTQVKDATKKGISPTQVEE